VNRLLSYFPTFIMSKKRFNVIFKIKKEILTLVGGDSMGKRKASHVIPGANAAKAQGMGAGYNEEMANEPLTEREKMNNKKRKKNQ
jgi:small acid-soluble spore protein O (minor)